MNAAFELVMVGINMKSTGKVAEHLPRPDTKEIQWLASNSQNVNGGRGGRSARPFRPSDRASTRRSEPLTFE